MPAKVVVIGLDAAQATLLEKWSGDGDFPAMAELIARGAVCEVARNPMETLPGSIWPELTTGISAPKLGQYYHPLQLHTGEARLRLITEDEINPDLDYWSVASAAGARVAVVDATQCVRNPRLNGLQLVEWGVHDRQFNTCSQPAGLLDELQGRHGRYPIHLCDDFALEESGRLHLRESLLDGHRRKSDLVMDLLGRESWDLFVCNFTETHCAGHHFWGFQDPQHSAYDAAAPQALKTALRTVYQRVDRSIGRILEHVGGNTLVMVVASHGMGPKTIGPQLLPEVLVRLGMSSDGGSKRASRLRQLQMRFSHVAPRGMVPLLKRLSRSPLVRRAQEGIGGLIFPLESPATRAVAVPNNRIGAIRLNLRGREPHGGVEPGREAEALLREIGEELLALRHVELGEPIVESVQTADEAFGAQRHPDVPDLLVRFRTDLGVLNSCRSERIGVVDLPLAKRHGRRTGDHTPVSRFWAVGPGIAAGTRIAGASTLDLAPTVLSLLGVAAPPHLDGKALALRPGRN